MELSWKNHGILFYTFRGNPDLKFILGATPLLETPGPSPEDKESLFDRQASVGDVSRPFLQALAEGRFQDTLVKIFLGMTDRYAKQHHIAFPVEFPAEHPVEEVGR